MIRRTERAESGPASLKCSRSYVQDLRSRAQEVAWKRGCLGGRVPLCRLLEARPDVARDGRVVDVELAADLAPAQVLSPLRRVGLRTSWRQVGDEGSLHEVSRLLGPTIVAA